MVKATVRCGPNRLNLTVRLAPDIPLRHLRPILGPVIERLATWNPTMTTEESLRARLAFMENSRVAFIDAVSLELA